MIFDPPLVRGTLIQRYKRFMADIVLDDGTSITAHCANPGAMIGLNAPGTIVWVQPCPGPKRKLAWRWVLVEEQGPDGSLVRTGIDTTVPVRSNSLPSGSSC